MKGVEIPRQRRSWAWADRDLVMASTVGQLASIGRFEYWTGPKKLAPQRTTHVPQLPPRPIGTAE